MAILNLAGATSIVFGLFDLGVFVMIFHFGMSLLSPSLTLACQALAMAITASAEGFHHKVVSSYLQTYHRINLIPLCRSHQDRNA